VSGCGSAIGQGPVHREYQEINKMINETMGSKNIYSSNRNIRVSYDVKFIQIINFRVMLEFVLLQFLFILF
jgi:hypothetical protein